MRQLFFSTFLLLVDFSNKIINPLRGSGHIDKTSFDRPLFSPDNFIILFKNLGASRLFILHSHQTLSCLKSGVIARIHRKCHSYQILHHF